MGFGVILTKVMIVVLQLLVAVVIVGSFATMATGDFDFQYGEPDFSYTEDFEDLDALLENGISINISVPLNLTIGGYWPVTDFQYSFSLVAANWNYIGGISPMDIEPGETADLSLNEEITYFPTEDDVYDLITAGTDFAFSMSISMGYLDNMFKFGAEIAATLSVGPFLEIGYDDENVTYDGTTLKVPIKFDPMTEQFNEILDQLYEEFGLDPADLPFDAENFSVDDVFDLLPEGVELPFFGASFTDDEGNVLWNGSASIIMQNGTPTVVIDITPEELEALQGQGADLRIGIDLSALSAFDDELPEEAQEIFQALDGFMILKGPSDGIVDKALEED